MLLFIFSFITKISQPPRTTFHKNPEKHFFPSLRELPRKFIFHKYRENHFSPASASFRDYFKKTRKTLKTFPPALPKVTQDSRNDLASALGRHRGIMAAGRGQSGTLLAHKSPTGIKVVDPFFCGWKYSPTPRERLASQIGSPSRRSGPRPA